MTQSKRSVEQELLCATASATSRWPYDRRDLDNAMRKIAVDIDFGDRRAVQHAKAVVRYAKARPDLIEPLDDYHRRCIADCADIIADDKRRRTECPIERLLAWETTAGQNFLKGEAYELLGKEDARTLRALIRGVVEMIDPAKATDV